MSFSRTLSRSARIWKLSFVLFFYLVLSSSVFAKEKDRLVVDPHTVPFADAEIGSCSVEFTIHDAAGAPVYSAQVKVHFSYGFMNTRKMDLEVWSNVDGKARFSGLTTKVKQPYQFDASQGDKVGSAVYDPAENCKAEHTIVLSKAAESAAPPEN